MRLGRKFTIAALLLLVMLGAALVFDQRLVSIRRESALAAYIYAPIVSVVAYSISFLGAWVIARTSRRLRLQSASDVRLENRK